MQRTACRTLLAFPLRISPAPRPCVENTFVKQSLSDDTLRDDTLRNDTLRNDK